MTDPKEELPTDESMRDIYVAVMSGTENPNGWSPEQFRERWDAWLAKHDRTVERRVLAVFDRD